MLWLMYEDPTHLKGMHLCFPSLGFLPCLLPPPLFRLPCNSCSPPPPYSLLA